MKEPCVKYLSTILLSLLTLAGCSLIDSTNPDVETSIEEELSLTLWEELDPEGKTFQLVLAPLSDDCSEAAIQYQTDIQLASIFLQIFGVRRPDPCESVIFAPATAVEMDLSQRLYSIVIQLGDNFIHQGTLKAGPDRYTLQLSSTDGIQISNPTLMRIPESLIWGYIAVDPDHQDTAAQFIGKVDVLTDQVTLLPGEYGYFRIGEDGVPAIPGTEETGTLFFFVRHLSDSEESLEEVLSQWRSDHPETRVVCRTWRGLEL